MNLVDIQKYISNRYPYLLIDRVTEVVPGEYAKGYKNLSINEWFYPVHFPEGPIMPGMIQTEALLQMFSIAVLTLEENRGKSIKVKMADKIRLKKYVTPGDRLDIIAEIAEIYTNRAIGKASGSVDGEVACEAEFIVDII